MESSINRSTAPKPRRKSQEARSMLTPEWGSVADCVTLSGFSAPHIWRAIGAEAFESIKAGEGKNSRRLVNLASFRAWIKSGARIPRREGAPA